MTILKFWEDSVCTSISQHNRCSVVAFTDPNGNNETFQKVD